MKNKKLKILNTISAIRNSHSQMENIFLNGSCLNMFLILRSIYPEAVAYFNINHVITKIDKSFYDITGCVSGKGYSLFTKFYNKRRTSRAFTNMTNSEFTLKTKQQ